MGNENVGQGLGLSVILIGAILSVIGLASIYSDMSTPTPDAIMEAQPPAAIPLSSPPAAAPASATPASAQDELQSLLQDWRRAWANRDTAAYLAFYAPGFQGNANSPEQWQANRKRILGKAKFIDIAIGKVEIDLENNDLATLTFTLDYASDRIEDHGTKLLQVRRNNGKWLIEHEAFEPN